MSLNVPIARWLPSYRRNWLARDLLAGATVWAVLVPSALAYAGIVGVDPIIGLYTVPLALVAYAVFGSSRLLVTGPDAAIAVLAATTVASVATGDDYLELVLALALLVGAIHLVMFVLRMGWIADLVPEPVLKGFIQGLVWVTILDQMPKLFGVSLVDPHDGFWRRAIDIVQALDGIQTETAVLGAASLVALFVLRRLAPLAAGPLIIVALTIVIVAIAELGSDGVALVGEPTGAAFELGLPSGITAQQIADLLPGALAITVLGFTQSIGAAKSAAQATGEQIDPNQELLALGAGNLAAGISGGYPVTGTLSKTSVAIASSGKTQVGNLFAAVLGVVTILLLRPLFEWLALTALAAVVVFAMSGMADLAYFRTLWQISRREFVIGLMAFLGVLTFGVLPGVVVGVVMSLILLVEHIGNPPTAILGRTPSGSWLDVERFADARQIDGLVVWRQEAPLVFINARRLSDRLRELAVEGIEVVVVDASFTSGVDSTGFSEFTNAADELRSHGVELWVVHPLAHTWEQAQLRAAKLGRRLPPVFDSVDDVARAFERRSSHIPPPAEPGD